MQELGYQSLGDIVREVIHRHCNGCVGDWWFLAHAPIDLSNLGVLAGVGWSLAKVESCCLEDVREHLITVPDLTDDDLRAVFFMQLDDLVCTGWSLPFVTYAWEFVRSRAKYWSYPWGFHHINDLGQHFLDPRRWLSEG